jgi:ribosomal protein S18 acetylase RimI-like enzyme
MAIRPAVLADFRAIASVHVACWQETYGDLLPKAMLDRQSVASREEQWRRTLERDPRLSEVFVAESDGAVVGFSASGADRAAGLGKDSEVYAIYVLRAQQRRGLGHALFQAAAMPMRDRGFRSIALWVLRENHPARRFYERIGGTIVAERAMSEAGASLVEIGYGWDDLDALATIHERRS